MACDGPAASTQAASQSKRDMARSNQTPGTTVWLCCVWRPFERCGGLAPVEGRLSHRGAGGETGCFCTHLGPNAGMQDEHRRRRPPQSFADGALGFGLTEGFSWLEVEIRICLRGGGRRDRWKWGKDERARRY
ncbi:hypothetical protein RB213_000134 [Colletotrichum asianum]